MLGSENRLKSADYSREAAWLKTLAQPARIKLLAALIDKARNAEELADVTGLPAATVGTNLRALKKVGIVAADSTARNARYEVAEPSVFQILRYLGITTMAL